MIAKGKKTLEWEREREKLKMQYEQLGITTCEWVICHTSLNLGFHHFDKRSSGLAVHDIFHTCLLCNHHHNLCEYNKEANAFMRKRHLENLVLLGLSLPEGVL
jgi:hexokinase